MRDDLYEFGGRLCVRSGWFWVPATPADLERIEEPYFRREARAWTATFILAALAAIAAILKEVL